ncbi:MAG: LysR family transcriptional regulator [Betaproteobacteria bacterium]|jgi:DNA-binding transcriptional LysR family regulator|nr:LysR family transcriptional regulator [Betaproteobacteria bacterium]NBT69687.1 LysR family transcriptional regulator [Betaproteobacteria bacterium]
MFNPNLKHLRIFVEIARRGSFRNAANALHLSEPATSQAVTQLESLMGVKLLDRTTRSVRISEAGSAFLADAERLLEGLDYSIAALREFASSGRGRVSIACLSSAVYRLLPPVLAEMKVQYPGIDVVFLDDNMRGILQKIDKAECDLAIVSEDSSIKLGLSIPLLMDTFQAVCRFDHPLAKRKKINGAELSNFEMILLRRGSGIRDELDRTFESNGIQLNVVNETTQILTLLGLVEAGLGVTVLPSMLCPDPAHGAVAVIPIQKPSVQRKLGLIFATAREPSAAARLLADVVQRTVASATLKVPPGVSKLV